MTARSQQFELYVAEQRVEDKGQRIDDPQAWVNDLAQQAWWTAAWPARVDVHVLKTRRHGSCGTCHDDNVGQMEMSPDHLCENYLCHELAHVVAKTLHGSESHDPWFARVYLELVYRVRGKDAWLALKAEFDKSGICYDEREEVK